MAGMKRYHVFAGDNKYYPSGEWDDFLRDFDTREAAEAYIDGWLSDNVVGWAHLVDSRAKDRPEVLARYDAFSFSSD